MFFPDNGASLWAAERLRIKRCGLRGFPVTDHHAVFQEYRSIAELLQQSQVVSNNDDRLAALFYSKYLLNAFFLEIIIPHGEGIVYQEDFRLHMHGYGECQA